MPRFGLIPATRENAHEVLTSGGVTIVFPGGDYDALRPQAKANVIDFNGRTGYVRTAIEAGVPIVPVVSIGGQEDQFHLTRGEMARPASARCAGFMRMTYFPVSFGFPFGLTPAFRSTSRCRRRSSPRCSSRSTSPPSSGPTRTSPRSTRSIRGRMQDALDVLARQRRFPVLG